LGNKRREHITSIKDIAIQIAICKLSWGIAKEIAATIIALRPKIKEVKAVGTNSSVQQRIEPIINQIITGLDKELATGTIVISPKN